MKDYNIIFAEKQQNYQLCHQVKLINMNILHMKKYLKKHMFSASGKTFEKQGKTIEDQGRKQIDAITYQNERLAALTIKGDHKDNH